MNKPKVSILVVSYNNDKQIDKLVGSIFKSDIKDQIEILVWDNNSTDKTRQKLVTYKKKITYTLSSDNLGFARAINKLIKQSQGDYVMLLNPDCVVKKTTMSKLLECSIAFSDDAAIVPKLVNSNGKNQESAFRFPTIWSAIAKYFFRRPDSYGKYWPGNKTTQVEVAVMAAMLISKKILDRIGLLDERFFLYYEDIEFCNRLYRNGYSVIYYPKAVVIHEHGASGKFVSHHQSPLLKSSYIYHGQTYARLLHFVLRLGQIWEKRILRKS